MAKGNNIETRKKNHRNKILNIIRTKENVSRFDVKKLSKLSMTTTIDVIEELLSEGLIVESGIGESTGGRKPTWLSINPKGGYFLGVEFNADNIHSAILDFSGSMIYKDKKVITDDKRSTTEIKKLIKLKIREMIDYLGELSSKILGIGIGVPGLVNVEGCISIKYVHVEGWNNINLKQEIEDEFHIPVYIENNVNAMALAYKWLEFGGVCNNFIFLSIRRGIRIGIIVNNELFRGKDNAAGEIGHIKVSAGTRLCHCGQKGCLDTEASNEALVTKIHEGIDKNIFKGILNMADGNIDKINISHFIKSFLSGDTDSKELLMEIANFIGEALSTVVTIINPERIVISGEITECGEQFLQYIREVLNKNCSPLNINKLDISYSKYGTDIGATGAASIVMQKEIQYKID